MTPDYLRVLEASPVPEVVAILEDALERAKAGEVIGVGLAMACAGRSEATSYALGAGSVAALVLATERLKVRLLAIGEEP
jgi:hypothetical protein